jgi:hypothetical protein
MTKIKLKSAAAVLIFGISILSFTVSIFFGGCSKKLDPEPLQLSVRQNLAMLQADAQFVMYFNFKKMRETAFWGKFINDSLISSERSFGNFLSVLKKATGASISNGIDELYFSNSWIGDNSMIVKGTFDRKKIEEFLKTDSMYSTQQMPPSFTVYKHKETGLNFFFKDDFTVCASNYIKIIEGDITATDTSKTGLLSNADAMKTIEAIKFKENLWMMSNQKLFIRGIFENFASADKTGKKKMTEPPPKDSLQMPDSTKEKGEFDMSSIYKKINAVSFSIKMTDELNFFMQNECEDNKSAIDLKNQLEAVTALVKLSSTFSKKKPTALIKTLDKMEMNVFDNTAAVQIKLSEEDVTEIRKQKIF